MINSTVDRTSRLTQRIRAAATWVRDAACELLPRGTSTVENLPDGETQNVRAFLRTHDLLSLPPGSLVTSWVPYD